MNPSLPTNPNLSAERLEALRRWIQSGEHNRRGVAQVVAERILSRGDLRADARTEGLHPRGPIH